MFLDTLARHYRDLPEKTAIELISDAGQLRVTYAQLEAHVNRTADYLLSLGVKRGDRVAVQLPKSLPFIYFHLAAMQVGAIFLPLNPAYPEAELRYFLEDSGASVFVADAKDQGMVDAAIDGLPAAEMTSFIQKPQDIGATWLADYSARRRYPLPKDPNQTAMMLYTSGTTSRPKGARITHGNLSANIASLHEAWCWREDDVLLHVLPIFHVHGLVVALHGALHAGATAALTTAFDAASTLELLSSGRFSVFMAVPTMHRRLFQLAGGAGERRFDLSAMRLLTSGSDRLPDDLFFGYQRTFNVTLLERYGMTETGMNLSNPLRGERRVGAVGLPLPGVAARIVDPESGAVLADKQVGELQIKGAHVFAGYWGQPKKTAEAFTEDGWLRTGDLALREPDGYYTLKGRAKDLIISGGLNIYPPEVELALMAHEAIAACAVIGCPDKEWGEEVVAVVVPQAGESIDSAEIIAYCRCQLAAYKAPRRVIVADKLPSNALGKVQKAKLRERCCS
ncbi:MAG: AMP-binding protein [Chloroflexota bacterium]|nr:AMP-binding protein [Chloroflexota bacterium]